MPGNPTDKLLPRGISAISRAAHGLHFRQHRGASNSAGASVRSSAFVARRTFSITAFGAAGVYCTIVSITVLEVLSAPSPYRNATSLIRPGNTKVQSNCLEISAIVPALGLSTSELELPMRSQRAG